MIGRPNCNSHSVYAQKTELQHVQSERLKSKHVEVATSFTINICYNVDVATHNQFFSCCLKCLPHI